MINNRRMFNSLKLLVSLLVVYTLLFTPSHAYAASWSLWSEGFYGSGYPQGNSMLSWQGYSSSAWGKSWGWLWYWTGSSWQLRSQGYSAQSGSNNAANAYTIAAYQAGWWTVTGAHTASFFSGQKNSYGNQFYC